MKPIDGFEPNGSHRNLFVVLHAFRQDPDKLKSVRAAIKDAYPDADIYAPRMPFAGWFGWRCTQDAADVVCDLIEAIDEIVKDRKSSGEPGYEFVNFVGHSMGAVFARKIAIIAHGEPKHAPEDANLRAPFEAQFKAYRTSPRPWAPLIKRIVLMAGMNRGWSTSSAMDWLTSAGWGAATLFGETFLNGTPIIFDIRQGAVFSVQTRLQWLALMHRHKHNRPGIVVTQLLGTVDDIVAPDDSVDYAIDSGGGDSDRSYFYLEAPNSGHKNIVDMERPASGYRPLEYRKWKSSPPDGSRAPSTAENPYTDKNLRYMEFRSALADPPEELATYAVPRDQMSDSLPTVPNWKVKDVVFVIHGIRDKGFWTQKIARAIKQEAAGRKQDFRSVTTSYGYFAMAPFVFPWVRKGKAEWLMDQYAETRAHYPRADFSYVGHSNGTYLVARALRDYPAARFKRIVLAGGVVRCDYNWLDLVASNRVREVLNYVATRDWVVAIFPKGMQPMPIFDLGGAGHDGFSQASEDGPVRQISFIAGGHGAGHEERHWRDIAKFVVSGDVPAKDASDQCPFVKKLGDWSTYLLFGILTLVLLGGLCIAWPGLLCKIPGVARVDWMRCASTELTAKSAALRTIGTILYFWVIYIVVSRV